MQLAHAAGDELGELAAEVEDRDRLRLLGRLGLDPLGRWRVEGLLEVGLDFGVVGCEDAVAGVGRLAVDRPSSLRGRWFVAFGQSRSLSAMMLSTPSV